MYILYIIQIYNPILCNFGWFFLVYTIKIFTLRNLSFIGFRNVVFVFCLQNSPIPSLPGTPTVVPKNPKDKSSEGEDNKLKRNTSPVSSAANTRSDMLVD